MNSSRIKRLLRAVEKGTTSVEEAVQELRHLPYEDLGFAKIDTHRALVKGFPEVVLCEGKTTQQVVKIIDAMVKRGSDVLATRASSEVAEAVCGRQPACRYDEVARILLIQKKPGRKKGKVLVVTGGTSDITVAEEAAVTAEVMGNRVERLYDVGVAGLHRLLDHRKKFAGARAIVVVAGMEGALASVVGGLVSCPVVAVPTSCGYGANFKGLSALLAMLNSCASGVAVMNIDNGFGAGFFAGLINQRTR